MIDLNLLKWIGGVIAGLAWFALVILGKASADTFVQFAQMVLVGLGAHGMTLSRPEETPPPPPKQSGKVSLLFLVALFLIIFALAGCNGGGR